MKAHGVNKAGASPSPATTGVKSKPKSLEEIRDYVDGEFKKAGLNIPVSIETVDRDGKKRVVLERTFVPKDQVSKLYKVLEFPELSDIDCEKIDLVTARNRQGMYIASSL